MHAGASYACFALILVYWLNLNHGFDVKVVDPICSLNVRLDNNNGMYYVEVNTMLELSLKLRTGN